MKTTLPTEASAKKISLGILEHIFSGFSPKHFNIRFWDGDLWPGPAPRESTLVLRHPGSLRQMFLGGSERSLAEAYLLDACDVEGSMESMFEMVDHLGEKTLGWVESLRVHDLLKKLPAEAWPVEGISKRRASLKGAPHSLERDRKAVNFHYDLSNDFYAMWLDAAMVYSCAYFVHPDEILDRAQFHKLDNICRKLALKEGQSLLDIGCGWGGLLLHAAQFYGVKAVGITLSENQAEYVRKRVHDLALHEKIEVRTADYREVKHESYDAIASIGMAEHVGRKNFPVYYNQVCHLLKPGGLFLNHAISLGAVPRIGQKKTFIDEYVFPDGDLVPLTGMLRPAEVAGLEIRDVENLREHYVLTLRQWLERLQNHHDLVSSLVGEETYRIFRLYLAGSAHAFRSGVLSIYQTLMAKLHDGAAGTPLSRGLWPGKEAGKQLGWPGSG